MDGEAGRAPASLSLAGDYGAVAGPAGALESIDQFRMVWRALVEDYGGRHGSASDVRDPPGLAIRWADSSFTGWNVVALADAGLDAAGLDARLAEAANYMRGKRRPGVLWVFEDLLTGDARAGLREAAGRAGLVFWSEVLGMAGDILPMPEPDSAGLTFRRVTSDEDLLAYADLNADAYGMPRAIGRDGLAGSALWKTDIHAFLALKDDKPASVAAATAAGDCVHGLLLATAADARRRGYGEATLLKAIYERGRASGLTRVAFHAMPAGYGIYRRMGMQTTATIGYFGLKG